MQFQKFHGYKKAAQCKALKTAGYKKGGRKATGEHGNTTRQSDNEEYLKLFNCCHYCCHTVAARNVVIPRVTEIWQQSNSKNRGNIWREIKIVQRWVG